MYKELSDYDKKNDFDVESYLEHRLKLRADEEFELIEVDGRLPFPMELHADRRDPIHAPRRDIPV